MEDSCSATVRFIYISDGDGRNRARLFPEDDINFDPVACGTGDVAVVARALSDNLVHLWRLNLATGESNNSARPGRGELILHARR